MEKGDRSVWSSKRKIVRKEISVIVEVMEFHPSSYKRKEREFTEYLLNTKGTMTQSTQHRE